MEADFPIPQMVRHSSLELCPGDGVRRWSLPCLVSSVLCIWSPFLEGKPDCLLRSLKPPLIIMETICPPRMELPTCSQSRSDALFAN